MEKNKRLWLLAIYLFLAVYLLPMFPHGGSANELTRWATTASLIEKGSFEMSWTEPLIGKNVDTARVDGHTYSNKPPGTALLAAPFYAVTRAFVGPPNASNIRVTWFVMRFVLSSLPLLLLGLWLYRKGLDEFSLAILLFATPLFVYSLLFFSHVLVGVLIYFAFLLLYDRDPVEPRRCFWSGILFGLAVLCEFPAIIPVAVLGVGILFTEKSGRSARVGRFVLGGAPFALLLMLYNYAIFGSPFAMSYAYESFPEWAEVAGQGVFGIGFPSLSAAYLLLLSPSRGLFFTAPILVLSVFSFFASPNRRTLRHRVKVTAIVATIIVMCGHGAAHGGWAYSARYLIIVVPLMLDTFFERENDTIPAVWQGLLFSTSLVLSLIPALTFPFAPPEFNAPHNDFWTRLLISENWAVPTFANVVGLETSLWLLVPGVLASIGVVAIVVASTRTPRRFVTGMLSGVLIVTAYLFWPGLESDEDKFRRATIAERYFRPAGRLEPYKQIAASQQDWPALRRISVFEWNIADTRSYAPNDFPYLAPRPLESSPSGVLRQAAELQQRGDADGAVRLLMDARARFPFAACEFASSLAVIHYTNNHKDLALRELESAQPLVNRASTPQCARSLYLLGTLYQELSRTAEAGEAFRQFMSNTEGSTDAEILGFRRSLTSRK